MCCHGQFRAAERSGGYKSRAVRGRHLGQGDCQGAETQRARGEVDRTRPESRVQRSTAVCNSIPPTGHTFSSARFNGDVSRGVLLLALPPLLPRLYTLLTLASPSLRGATAACPPSSLPPNHSTGGRTARPDPSPLPRPYKRRPRHFMASQILSPQPLPHHGHATTRSSRPSPPVPLTPHQGAYLTRACLSSTLDMFDILSRSGRLLGSSHSSSRPPPSLSAGPLLPPPEVLTVHSSLYSPRKRLRSSTHETSHVSRFQWPQELHNHGSVST